MSRRTTPALYSDRLAVAVSKVINPLLKKLATSSDWVTAPNTIRALKKDGFQGEASIKDAARHLSSRGLIYRKTPSVSGQAERWKISELGKDFVKQKKEVQF